MWLRARASSGTLMAIEAAQSRDLETSTMSDSFDKVRVLMIDGDTKLCRLVKDSLEPMGYDVASVHIGPQGVEQLRAGNFQVIIRDVMLPGMDGFEVLRQIRRFSTVPV